MGQLSALFYKNWLLYKRSLFGNILQILVPVFFIACVLLAHNLESPITYNQSSFLGNTTYSKTINSRGPVDQLLLKSCDGNVGLAPSNDRLIGKIQRMLINLGFGISRFTTEGDLQNYVRRQDYGQNGVPSLCYGITVQNSSSENFQYKLRFNISSRTDSSDGPPSDLDLTLDQAIDLDLYERTLTRGMVGANVLVHSAILQLQTGNNSNYFSNTMSPVYQQQYTLDKIYFNLKGTIGFLIVLPLLLIYLRQTSIMLTQKETKIRESMFIMGMRGINYYFSWFVRYFAIYFVVHLLGSIILVVQFEYIPFYVPFVVFLMFDIVLIIQNFFIQTFLTRAKIGVLISLLFFLVQFILSFMVIDQDDPSIAINRVVSLIPHVGIILAFRTMLYCQSFQVTANFTEVINSYVIGYALIGFLINIILYLLLTWYLDQVIPNEWGAKKHPLFCCFSNNETLTQEEKEEMKRKMMSEPGYQDRFEQVDARFIHDEQNNKSLEIVGLRKQYGSGEDNVIAVSDLTVSMYQSQIFALLGHNGAGKTTTISMLTGMTSPSGGYLSVFGQTQTDKIRQVLGVCPQHDTLYQDLTVEQHIQLFGSLKGLEGQELKRQVQKLIFDVNLPEKRFQYCKNLSGGQKRRLSVAIAFAGRSKVIILDEPTSGMDTSARRFIWEMLKGYKNDRIIILTTHFMDQADYLGDRIGIMGDGHMLCCGSNVFLKNKFGSGYLITFVKKSAEADTQPILQTVKKFVPDCKVVTNVVTDLAIELPLKDIGRFPAMFKELDEKKSQLQFSQYGISITTLEEVFLSVAEKHERMKNINQRGNQESEGLEIELIKNKDKGPETQRHMMDRQKSSSKQSRKVDKSNSTFDFDNIERYEGCCSKFWLHFKATFLKRLRVIRRDFKSFIFELILPFIIILGSMFLLRVSFITDFPSRTITLETYLTQQNPVVVPLGADNVNFANQMRLVMEQTYPNSTIRVDQDTNATTNISNFDQFYVFPRKLEQKTLKGGIFFVSQSNPGTYQYYNLVNTRSPSSPLFLSSLAAQTYINQIKNTTNKVRIKTSNHPLPRTNQQLQLNNLISGFNAGFIFSIALAFKFASIIAFIVKERVDRSKYQQLVSGMNVNAYWTANLVYDFILYLIVAILAIVITKAFDITALVQGDAFGATWLLFILYGLSYISFTYIASFYYQDYGNAQASFYFITLVAGGLIPIITFLLRALSDSSNQLGRSLAWVFRLYPSFAFGQGLINLGSKDIYGIRQNNSNPMQVYHAEIALAPIIYLAVGSVLFFIVLLIVQNNQSFMRCCSSDEAAVEYTQFVDEEDVMNERRLALEAHPAEYQILTKSLRKVYKLDGPSQYKVAVDNLSFGIKRGEVFGLLGINGAGKTTTFKMLAGQISSTSGNSYIKGLKVSEQIDTIRQDLGYCPQFDALIQNLSTYEQLQLFYDLKSLVSERRQAAISHKIDELDLKQYTDKLSGTLSGGNKRKLSVAMAMIGNPRIVFLDEPSTGMDPKARRFMWKVIARVATERRDATVMLTTHSMEEAQALSSRLGIMVHGNFRCIGSPQHIKSKYGQGLQLEIKLIPPSLQELNQSMRKKKIQPQLIKRFHIEELMNLYKVAPYDRVGISPVGNGSYIYNILEAQNQVQLIILVEYFQVCAMFERMIGQLRREIGPVDQMQRFQTFSRLKVWGRDNIGKLFELLQNSRERLRIQQYSIKQASVEQIFNQFAEQADQEPLIP